MQTNCKSSVPQTLRSIQYVISKLLYVHVTLTKLLEPELQPSSFVGQELSSSHVFYNMEALKIITGLDSIVHICGCMWMYVLTYI